MSKTSDRVTRMLALIPYLKENPRIEVSEVARKFSVSEQTIESDVIKLFMCGLPRGLPDDLIEIDYDALKNDGIIEIRNADFINRPVKILQSEAFSTLVALETLRASATSPASFCQLLPQLDPVFYPALAQSLYIRITNDKFNPMNSLPEHMVYGITSTSADTDHLNDRFFLSCIR